MKILKKIICVILLCVISLSMYACGPVSNTGGGITFVDFDDVQIEVQIGTYFDVKPYMTVVDSDGNSYKANANIRDSKNNEVVARKYEFLVEDKDGYTITLTLNSETKEYKRVVTLKIIDEVGPSVAIGLLPDYGIVNTKYTIPVTILDGNSEGITTEMVVTFNNDVVQSDGLSFVPTQAGVYDITITATDVQGNSTTRTKSFMVITQRTDTQNDLIDITPSAVDCFASYDIQNTGWPVFTSYVTSYENKEGALRLDIKASEHIRINMKSTKTEAELLAIDWDYISIMMYVSTDKPFEMSFVRAGAIPLNQWTEVKIFKSDLIDGSSVRCYEWRESLGKFCKTAAQSNVHNALTMFISSNGRQEDMAIYIHQISLKSIPGGEDDNEYTEEFF